MGVNASAFAIPLKKLGTRDDNSRVSKKKIISVITIKTKQ
jgi:hypothetical protein